MSAALSVVIPAHNAARWIAEAVASVQAQALQPAPDVVVVANHCSDDTATIAAAAGARVIDSPAPGPAAARNAGVAATTTPHVAFLDADDLWPPASCAARLALLDATPDAAMVFGDCLQFDDDDDGGGRRMHARSLFAAGGLDAAFFGDPVRVIDPLERLLDADFVTTGAVIMRRSAFDALGGFDPTLPLVEDLDLWLRTAARYPVLWHGATALLRRRHGSNLSRDAAAMQRAYIDVLARLAALPEAQPLRARIRRLQRREHRALARTALAAGRPLQALAHGWRGCTP
jgi:glycosyltransferase involved in cell wall biosynthesis